MSAPAVDSNYNSQDVPPNDDDDYDPNLDNGSVDNNRNPPVDNSDKAKSSYKSGSSNKTPNAPTPGGYGTGSKSLGMGPKPGGVAPGGDVSPTGVNSDMKSYAQQLSAQGYTQQQIHDLVLNKYGVDLSQGDLSFLLNGYGSGIHNQYPQYNTMSKNLGGSYTSWGSADDGQKLMKMMQDQQQMNDAKDTGRQMKKDDQDQKVKIHMILLQIMMGDLVGALRSYAVLRDRDAREFTRTVMDKLDKVRVARTQVIRNFANTTPPTAYAGNNPQQAARAQDRSSKYTQYVQMSTQLMSELQNTEKELVYAETTITRDNQTFWESYASFRDQEFRTNDRVMSTR